MTLRHFRIFVTVCDKMNMTLAAEILFISQSAVSQAVAELEKYYDVRLFERLSRRLYLTSAGEKLLSYARHMLSMNEIIEKEMKALHDSGLIRLGASVTVGAGVLPPLIREFKIQNSTVEIEVFEDNTQQIERRLLSDETDIGLVEGDTVSPDIVNIPFIDDELVLVCGTRHRFAEMSVVKPEYLAQEDFIIREQGSGTRKLFEETMSVRGFVWKPSWTCNNADTIKAAVAAGLGITVISKMAVEKEVKAGELISKPIENMNFARRFKLVYHKNKYLSMPMKTFISFCLDRYQK